MTTRIGLVGIGWWATANHIPTLQNINGVTVAAICDLDAERIRIAGDTFDIASRYCDLDAMLAAESLAGVIVSTPHVAHAAPAIAALHAGCHVLIEKPMATTVEDARAIALAAKETGRAVLVSCGMNFTGFTARAAALVRAGRIGKVRHCVCQMGSPLNDLFAGEQMLETEGHLFRPPSSTWADPEKAGGYGWGQLSHALSWLFHVADIDLETVYCMTGKSKTGADFYDAAVARTTDGATVSIAGSATVPKQCGMHIDIRIYGTEGMIVFDNERARLELRRLDGADLVVPISQEDAVYDGTLPVRRFAEFCAGSATMNPCDSETGSRVTAALDAIYRSAREECLIRIGG